MYKKLFEHYITLCLLKQITMIVYVSGRPTDSEETKPISDDALDFLTRDVCMDLKLLINVREKTCHENFWVPDPSMPKLSPLLKIRCQSRESIRFQIERSENWQLVLLVPLLTNDSDTDMDYINYSLVEPMTEYGIVSTTPPRNYTIWSTELNKGSPQLWRGGDKAPLYNESMQPEYRPYDIRQQFNASVDNPLIVNGLFTWNTSGDADVCFDVMNSCEKTGMESTTIWPNNNEIAPQIVFYNLSVNDDCQMLVTGLYGPTKLQYHTPCDEDCLSLLTEPEIPENVTIIANQNTSDTWELLVSWSLPHRLPDQYNVTLRTDTIQTVVLPGNATEAVFKDVVGEGMYNVSVYAVRGRLTAHTSRRANFPVLHVVRGIRWRHGRCGRRRGMRGRRRTGAAVPLPQAPAPRCAAALQSDGETEVLEIWSESVDRWEVRPDKLVLHEVIGEGAFGVVRRATLAPHSTLVAVKMLKDFPSLEEIRSFRSEMELMKSVGVHAHLVSLVGCCSGKRPLIIAEYCSRGDLLSYLRCTWDVMLSKRNAKYYNNNLEISDYRNDLFKCKAQIEDSKLVVNKLYDLQEICDKELTALDLLSFCRQIAMGMEFLAANRVVHRDLAARNILVTADRTLKIADFGLSRDVYEENQYKQKGNGKMPVKWMALESLTRRIYTTQSDVWSFGVVVWEVATVGGAPYASVPAARLPRLLRSGYRMPKPNNCSPLLYDLMLSCWRTHPRERPTFAQLHQRLDELLNSACADQYLSLEIGADDAPPTPKHHRYIKMLIGGKRSWSRGENYERPLKAPRTNHYTSPPDSLNAHPV